MGTKRRSKKSLSAGRPPTTRKPTTISRKATKAVINTHHQLEKEKQKAIKSGDSAAVEKLGREIEALGGIGKYQQASLQGQRDDRGGDSSRVLMEWLEPVVSDLKSRPLRMLEVGALSTNNACSKSGCFEIERIDLNSQGEGIRQQDFMKRQRPKTEEERFDIISLSLVLNYVPDYRQRGSMLLQTLDFLREPGPVPGSPLDSSFPGLFLVLPEACVSNSRYLDEKRLEAIMKALGYEKVQSKATRRLVYYLWKRVRGMPDFIPDYMKKEIRKGASRNNFAIVLQTL